MNNFSLNKMGTTVHKNLQGHFLQLAMCFLSLLSATPLLAQWSNNTNVNTLVSSSPMGGSQQQMMPDGAGGTYIVWRAGDYNLYMQRLNASGVAQWAANGIPLCTAQSGINNLANQDYPMIISDGAGGAIIAWEDIRDGRVTPYHKKSIYAQRVTSAGAVLWGTNGKLIATSTDESLARPFLTTDGAGGAFIAYSGYVITYNGNAGWQDFFVQRVTASGDLWANPVTLAYDHTTLVAYPGGRDVSILSDGVGGAYIQYMFGPYEAANVFVNHVTETGALWSAPTKLSQNGTNSNTRHTGLVSDGAGGVIALFQQNTDIRTQRINSSGGIVWTSNPYGVNMVSGSGINQHEYTLTTDDAGGAIAIWRDYRSSNYDIYAQRVNGSGAVQWAANGVPVSTAANNQISPSCIPDGHGGIIATWNDGRSGSHIYAQRVNNNGTMQWATNGVALCTHASIQETPAIASDGAGGAVVVFPSRRISIYLTALYAQQISASGTLGAPCIPPTVAAITGESSAIVGTTTTLASTTSGGTWSSSSNAVATVSTSGVVTGVSAGTVTISYTVSSECGNTTVTKVLTVTESSSYCLKFVPHRVGNTVEMTVRMIGSGSPLRLGDANLQIKYNSAALGSPTLVSEVFTANGHYSGISVTEPAVLDLAPNEAVTSINSSFTGTTGQGLAISNDPEGTLIAVIRFQVLDAAIAPNLQSYINDDIGSILFNDNTTNPALVPSTGGCTGYNIALATVLTYSQTGYCVSVTSQAANLVGTTGGTFSSTTGLTLDPTTGAINPSTSTVGTYWVTYTIPSSQGGTTATQVTINPLPTPAITSLNALYCHGVAPFALTGTPVGGTFTIDGNPATNFDASTLSIGTHNVIYSYSDANSCSATASQNVEVNAAPVVPAITGESYVFLGYTITLSNTAVGGTWSSSNTTNATIDAAGVVTGVALGNTTVSYAVTNVCGTTTATKAIEVRNNSVELALKALLHGNYNTTTGLMSDDLRTSSLIPSTEPYTGVSTYTHRGTGGGEAVASNVLTVSGNDAIVDWMFIELRDKNAPRTILYTRAALIQRDGDIVDVDGVSPVVFSSVIPDNYYIAIRHRNHLGFRTASAVAVGRTAATTLDLSNNSVALFGRNPLKLASNGKYMMHGGNGDNNAAINSIDKNIIWLPQNGTTGYKRPDFNLDGVVNAFDINGVWLYSNSVIQQLDF